MVSVKLARLMLYDGCVREKLKKRYMVLYIIQATLLNPD